MLREQIVNRRREQNILPTLLSITNIDDETSLAVRTQYEDNPYPRWVSVQSPRPDSPEALIARLRPSESIRVWPRPVQILVAGCGTGYVPIQFARSFPGSEILAVDLSRASLAYAVRMTEELGVSNVTYRQADILNLGALDRQFAIVESSGVLHHLRDPMAGWSVLVDLLAPDGVMKIGLYSKIARRGIQAARELAQSLQLPATPEGIRRCREVIFDLPEGSPAKAVVRYPDFYVLDGCRDMIFNVMEHQFTFPLIGQCLDQLDLRFLGIETSTSTSNRFQEMFPVADDHANFEAWDEFEEANPDAFVGMYQFWCCKR
jgi:SAM-dependent methyltransferase